MKRQRPRAIYAMAVVAAATCSCGDTSESSARATKVMPSISEGNAAAPVAPPQERITRVLTADFDTESNSVRGQWGAIRFETRLESNGQAIVRFRSLFDGGELHSGIISPTEGRISWAGSTIDGYGALSEVEATALTALENSALAEALARIPLDLSCREGAHEVDPALGAALVLPWQLLLKYGSQAVLSSVRGHAARSPCEHFRSPLKAWDPQRTPSPAIVALSFEQSLPVTAGYFPFNQEGAAR